MRRANLMVTLVIAAVISQGDPPRAHGQCDFNLTRYNVSGVAGAGNVNSLAVFDDGSGFGPSLVVGGDFDMAGGAPVWGVARWNQATGWRAMGSEIYYVNDLTVFNNELYARSSISTHVWKWNGVQWVTVGGAFSPAYSRKLFVFDNGSGPALYATTSYHSLYRLDDGDWTFVASFDNAINAVTTFDDGRGQALYLGGWFTQVNGMPFARIVRWDGTPGNEGWTGLGSGISDGSVNALEPHAFAGKPVLAAGGTFTQAGSQPATHMATWDGADWAALPPTSQLHEIRVDQFITWDDASGAGDRLYAVSATQSPSSGDTSGCLYRFDESGTWTRLGWTWYLPFSGIYDIIKFDDGQSSGPSLYIGGKFSKIIVNWNSNEVSASHLVRVKPHPDSGFAPTPSDPQAIVGPINALIKPMADDGAVMYAGGRLMFWGNAGSQYNVVDRFDGKSWSAIGTSTTQSAQVLALAIHTDAGGESLFAAGNFTNISGVNANRIAIWNGPASKTWSALGAGLDGTANALCVHDDGNGPALYVAGQFTTAGGAAANNVAKWNGTAGGWSALGSGTNGVIHALASFDDGAGEGSALYAGGAFAQAGGAPASCLARWNGKSWSSVGGGVSGPNAKVFALHVHQDGAGLSSLIVGGSFTHAGEIAAPKTAQWNGPAQGWSALGNIESVGDMNAVGKLTTFDDGSGPAIVASCGYWGATSVFRGARWNGKEWATFGRISLHPSATPDGALSFLAIDGALYSGSKWSLAKWESMDSDLAIEGQSQSGAFQPNSYVQLGVDIVHGGAVVYQWRKNGNPLEDNAMIKGAHRDRLLLSNVTGAFEGTYDVIVRNDCEFIVSLPIEVEIIGTCLGDVQIDGVVNVNDLLAVINSWGACPATDVCPADLNHDRLVSGIDLQAVINAWGACP